MTIHTADICDEHIEDIACGRVRVSQLQYQHFGQKSIFHGQVVTLKAPEQIGLLRQLCQEDGIGKVLVIDGAASMRTASMGGRIAQSLAKNGWEGVIVYGAIRDRHEIDIENLGVRALGLCPIKPQNSNAGEINVSVRIGDIVVNPGDWLYADLDGFVVCDNPLF